MLPFLEREYPDLAERYRELYATGAHLGRAYKEALAARVRRVRDSVATRRPEGGDDQSSP